MNARLLLIILLCLTACAKSTDEIKWESKRELLAALPEQVIIPAYRRFAAATADLGKGIDRYCTGKNFDPLPLQEQWRITMTFWQETAAYAIGPIAENDLPALINYPVIKKSKIEYWLEPGRIPSAGEIKSYSVQGKGLGALEYLLFETGIQHIDPQYCAYLSALAGDLHANADRILQLLESGHGNHPSAAGWIGGDDVLKQQALDELLNAILQAMETVKDNKLGVPLGKKNNGAVQPDKVESWRSEHSLRNIRANIASLQNIFYGASEGRSEGGFGLKAYLQKTDNSAAAITLEQNLQQIMQNLGQVPGALQIAIHEYPATVEAVYSGVAALCSTLENAVLPAFDVQAGFNAKDGD